MSRTWTQGEVIAFMVARCNDCINKPVKHGRWIKDNGLYKCSVCNNFTITGWDIPIKQMKKTMKYCNNCGARMDEVEE